MELAIYGKIIIDEIRARDGTPLRRALGGGGPQALFGARLWGLETGFLSRSGGDLDAASWAQLASLGADLRGWREFPEVQTPRGLIQYDEEEYLISMDTLLSAPEEWEWLLAQPLALPPDYQTVRAIHLVTEFGDEPMVQSARTLQAGGALFSLEPIVYYESWHNREEMIALCRTADVVTPDWPTASGIAGRETPAAVLAYWARLGPALVAIRHGRHGAYVWGRDEGASWHVPPTPVAVRDPTGAGNAFGGGLIAGWLRHGDARRAACCGAISAAFLIREEPLPSVTGALQAEAAARLATALTAVRPLRQNP